jgi:magnesium transporter
MSMIRDLRAAVRPAPRETGSTSAPYDTTRDPSMSTAVVDCAVYRDGARVHDSDCLTPGGAILKARRDGGFAWIGLHEPTESEFAGIAAEFGLHPLAVEDAVHAHQRPKLERYDDTLFLVLRTAVYLEHDVLTPATDIVGTGEIMAFAGRDFIVVVRHDPAQHLGPVRRRLEGDPERLAHGPVAVLHAIADTVVDQYLDVVTALETDADQVENDAFSPDVGYDVGRVYQLKRELLELRRTVAPLAQPLRDLAERRVPGVDREMAAYFRDVADLPQFSASLEPGGPPPPRPPNVSAS